MKNEAFAPTPELLAKMDAWWRAANYLSACQLYLLDDPLLRRRLTERDIKKKIVGHWGTVPGQNFIYTHLNRVINEYDLDMIYLSGPGHGGNAMVAQDYLDGSYTDVYPNITRDAAGMQRLFKQFSFPGGKPKPSRLVSGRAEFVVSDSQLIGTKVIVKGSAELAVCYLSDEVNYPVRTEFCTPFSQIIDIGEECMDSCCTSIELTGAYFDIIDTVNGDKALDAELHAVMQLVCRSRKRMTYIADAYSNLMPAECRRQSCRYDAGSEVQKLKLAADERISIVEDCADVLSAFVSVAHISQEQTKISAAVNVDVVYRSSQGQLAAVRRSIGMEGEGSASVRISSARLTDVYLRPDGQYVDGHMALELSCVSVGSVEVRRVDSIELDEENGFDLSQYPAVTLVRAGDETMWELAKEYHSSVEKISAANPAEDAGSAGLLLIPKCV